MITVMITGHAGEGKSTIAVLIAKCLEDNGIKVEYVDDNGSDNDVEDRKTTEYYLPKRIAGFAEKSDPVLIRTKQSARSPYKAKN